MDKAIAVTEDRYSLFLHSFYNLTIDADFLCVRVAACAGKGEEVSRDEDDIVIGDNGHSRRGEDKG